MSRKLIIYIILSIACMGTIFCFSSRNTIESNNTSKNLIRRVIDKYEYVTGKKINK